jgi:cytochrome P450
MTDTASSFPVPFAAPDRQSWRQIAGSLAGNALASFPPRAFEEMVVGRNFAGRRQIILNDPAAIRHVLIENADNYRRTASVFRLLGPVIGRGLFLAEGEEWRGQRRTAAPAFAPRMMRGVAEHVGRIGERFVAGLAAEGGAAIEFVPRLQLLTLEIAATALFSFDIAAEGPALRAEMRRYAEGIGRPTLLDFLLPHGWPAPRSFVRWRFRRRWMARMAMILAARRAEPVADPPRDLFDMMAAVEPGDRLIDEVATMLIAGHETTAVALFWALYLIAALPEVQDRMFAEAAALDLGPAGAAAAVAALPYTRAVADEVLRLYPPAFAIARMARAADNASGVAIPARGIVLIVPWVLHRHRLLWHEPDRFDPGRFLPGSEPPARFSYLPFSTGLRACIGAQFALTEMVLVLARLAQAFRIERADDQPVLPLAQITLQPDRSPLFRLRAR